MAGLLNVIRSWYCILIPLSIRKSRLVTKLIGYLLPHDILYNSDYYANSVEGPAVTSAGAISDSILSDLKPRTVIDVGCGTGALLEELREGGCEGFGLEYSDAALNYCRARQLNVTKFDIERDVLKDRRTFDVAVSMEVAEHLPEKAAARYVDLLTRLSSLIVFTAAPPGQGGINHVNEKPPSYWISKFQPYGFEHDKELSQRWRDKWKSTHVVSWYCKNLMIFRKI